MRINTLLIIACFVAYFIVACAPESERRSPGIQANASTVYMVTRMHDDSAHVTCWILDGFRAISCIPDSQLRIQP